MLIYGSLLFLAIALYLIGPIAPRRVEEDLLNIPQQGIEAYLAGQEAHFDLMEGANKQVTWALEPEQRSDRALLYFHGFAATRHELEPVPGQLCKRLSFNRFDTRFKGHGIHDFGETLRTATFQDWIHDAQEAIEIGDIIADKKIVMAYSTGAAAALWAAWHFPQKIEALILIAPNFKINHPFQALLTMPWGGQLVDLFLKKYRKFQASDWWDDETLEYAKKINFPYYPQRTILSVAVAALFARSLDFSKLTIPVLIFLDTKDAIVCSKITKDKIFPRIASRNKKLIELNSYYPHHLICGKMGAVENNERILEECTIFLEKIREEENLSFLS